MAAVSSAGGFGQITAMILDTPEQLREEIHKVRQLTEKSFGVNYAINDRSSYEEMVQVAIGEKVPTISVTRGNPTQLLKMVENTGIKNISISCGEKTSRKG